MLPGTLIEIYFKHVRLKLTPEVHGKYSISGKLCYLYENVNLLNKYFT